MVGTLGVAAFLFLAWLIGRANSHGPQHWLGFLIFASMIGAILYQMWLRA